MKVFDHVLLALSLLASANVLAIRLPESNVGTLTLHCSPPVETPPGRSASSLRAEQGDTIWCNASLAPGGGDTNVNGDLPFSNALVYPFVNGTQWGAHAPLLAARGDSTGVASIAFPLPRLGVHTLQVAVLPSLGSGPVIGTTLASLSAKVFMHQTNDPTTVHVSRRTNPSQDFLSTGNHSPGSPQTVMDWEPWFTPHNGFWEAAEAIPLVGQYSSLDIAGDSTTAQANRDVIRQHCLWWAMAGTTAINVDWTNNLWNIHSWDERPPGAREIINATILTAEFLGHLRAEGEFPIPQFVLMVGLFNDPDKSKVTVLGDQIDYLYEALYQPTSLTYGVGMQLEGKPLLIIFDSGDSHHANFSTATESESIGNFTIRWMSSQFQGNHLNRKGFFSWMDGTIKPLATPMPSNRRRIEEETDFNANRGDRPKNEALTITNGFFKGWLTNGWLGADAEGTHNGATLLLEYDWALKEQPEILFICQWNEYRGNPSEAPGAIYEDIYNATLGNDMEPTALTTCGHNPRPNNTYCGGWGFRFLNLLRFGGATRREVFNRSEAGDSLQVAIRNPTHAAPITKGALLEIQTSVVGTCQGFTGVTYFMDGVQVGESSSNSSSVYPGAQFLNNFTISTKAITPGIHWLKAVAMRGDNSSCTSWAPANDLRPSLRSGPASQEVEFEIVG